MATIWARSPAAPQPFEFGPRHSGLALRPRFPAPLSCPAVLPAVRPRCPTPVLLPALPFSLPFSVNLQGPRSVSFYGGLRLSGLGGVLGGVLGGEGLLMVSEGRIEFSRFA